MRIDVTAAVSVPESVPVVVVGTQAEYDNLVALVMRTGSWLSSPQAQLLSSKDWDMHFARYQEQLERLRVLGDELRVSKG